MSKKILFNNLSDNDIENINNDLTIQIPQTNYTKHLPPKILQPWQHISDTLYLPFSFSLQNPHLSRPSRQSLPTIYTTFSGKLRPHQIIVRNDALSYLNKN